MNPTDSVTKKNIPLAIAALGIVFGDIGTSPLYALKACFSGFHAVPTSEMNILGVLSLVFWSLTVVISLKYVSFVMRADNRGEGGIIALFSLLPEKYRLGRPVLLAAACSERLCCMATASSPQLFLFFQPLKDCRWSRPVPIPMWCR